jgi:hypothetical protein
MMKHFHYCLQKHITTRHWTSQSFGCENVNKLKCTVFLAIVMMSLANSALPLFIWFYGAPTQNKSYGA